MEWFMAFINVIEFFLIICVIRSSNNRIKRLKEIIIKYENLYSKVNEQLEACERKIKRNNEIMIRLNMCSLIPSYEEIKELL